APSAGAATLASHSTEFYWCTRSASAVAVVMYFEEKCATRSRHIPTNASDVSFSTDFHAPLTAGSVLPQIARLHHFSPFSLPSLVAHIDFQAMRLGWLRCSAAPSQPCRWIRWSSFKSGLLCVPHTKIMPSLMIL